jgi:hypothetical protein
VPGLWGGRTAGQVPLALIAGTGGLTFNDFFI